jgi:hypothetical protein
MDLKGKLSLFELCRLYGLSRKHIDQDINKSTDTKDDESMDEFDKIMANAVNKHTKEMNFSKFLKQFDLIVQI